MLFQEGQRSRPTCVTSQAPTGSACITRYSYCLQEEYIKTTTEEFFQSIKFKANKPLSLFLHDFLKSMPERYFPCEHIITTRCFVL